MWVAKLGLGPFFSITIKLWRSETGAHFLVHIWLLKLGTHFSMTTID